MSQTVVGRTGAVAAAGAARRRSRRHRFLPPQHGAWAMLVVPYLLGVLSAGWSWLQLPLLVAWLSGYLLSYYLFLAMKTRRPARVRPQLLVYSAITVPTAVVVLLGRPELLAYAPVYAVLFGVNAWYAWRRSDRALVNDFASVVEGCLMVLVAAGAAGVGPDVVLGPFLVALLYFVGTVLYVKTMIRERGERGYLLGSVGYHAAAVVPATLLAMPLALPFAWFLVRSAWFPRLRITPKQVGLVEIANCAVLLVMVPLLMV
jgi:hypothetical protein